MDDQLFENLAKRNPDLFEKSQAEYMSVGNGWYNIISTLCDLISAKVLSARSLLRYEIEHKGDSNRITAIESELAAALEELPTITYVKEKFGTLRFYVNGGNDTMYHYIDFAEAHSYTTCEICGAPGVSRTGGWVKTLCNQHASMPVNDNDNDNENDIIAFGSMKTVKLDEEPDDLF